MSHSEHSSPIDDLTQIKGIGETTAQWLRDTFDAVTFEDVAHLDADTVLQKLKDEGRISSKNRIAKWISQAAELAVTAPPKSDTSPSTHWEAVATFVVVFEKHPHTPTMYQTKVHHMEADVSQSWDNIQKQALGNWIIEQLDAEIRTLAETNDDLPKSIQRVPEAKRDIVVSPRPTGDPTPTAATKTATSDKDKEDAAATQPTHSSSDRELNKLHTYVTKADAITGQSSLSPPAVAHDSTPSSQKDAAPSPSHHEGKPLSDRLRRYIHKVDAITGQQSIPISSTSDEPVAHQVEDILNPTYSDKLNRYLQKAQALASHA